MYVIKTGSGYISEKDYDWLVEVSDIKDATRFSSSVADDIIDHIGEGEKISVENMEESEG